MNFFTPAHRDQFALGQRSPSGIGERHAGNQHKRLLISGDRYPTVVFGRWVSARAMPLQDPQSGRFDLPARALYATVAMREQGIAICVEKIGRPEGTQV